MPELKIWPDRKDIRIKRIEINFVYDAKGNILLLSDFNIDCIKIKEVYKRNNNTPIKPNAK
jgi:hypothetical protein